MKSYLLISFLVKVCVCFTPIKNPSYTNLQLARARTFNQLIAPALCGSSYKKFRKAMNNYGLSYSETSCTVGHCIPASKGGANLGYNLFAQFEDDNRKLGPKKVNCGELFYYYRTGPPCTCTNENGVFDEECPLWMEH